MTRTTESATAIGIDALAGLKVEGLVTGDLQFDENGDAIKNYVAIKTFQDGQIVFSDAYQG